MERVGLLRERGEGETRVTPIELFFDLVYVLAVTQLTHHLLDHLTLRGAAETLLLLLAVWTAWSYTSWITNWFDPNALPVRLMLVGVMLGVRSCPPRCPKPSVIVGSASLRRLWQFRSVGPRSCWPPSAASTR